MMMMTIDRLWTWPSADLPRTEIVMQYNGDNLDMALRGPVPINSNMDVALSGPAQRMDVALLSGGPAQRNEPQRMKGGQIPDC